MLCHVKYYRCNIFKYLGSLSSLFGRRRSDIPTPTSNIQKFLKEEVLVHKLTCVSNLISLKEDFTSKKKRKPRQDALTYEESIRYILGFTSFHGKNLKVWTKFLTHQVRSLYSAVTAYFGNVKEEKRSFYKSHALKIGLEETSVSILTALHALWF